MTISYRFNRETKQVEIVNAQGEVLATCTLAETARRLTEIRHEVAQAARATYHEVTYPSRRRNHSAC